ncbi:hypothetical protein NQ317_015684 [Molorchus minor]|uniref:RNase H type-1 domain-containing protein n=1 Tax=Molorchus minor TaxID=1323400 RepID=A0ABQ9JMP0_9CUCU|nr:hypothetical protein NQ317_015684 [Molorchus minor]
MEKYANIIKLLSKQLGKEDGHSGQEGNKIADFLARKVGASNFIGPKPTLGVSYNTAKMTVLNWPEKSFGTAKFTRRSDYGCSIEHRYYWRIWKESYLIMSSV